MKTQIKPEVISVLKRCTVEGSILKLPPERLPNYKDVNQVLEILGGKWNRKVQGHVFEEDPSDVLADAINTGELLKPVDFKKLFQFFPTPPDLAERMVKLANISRNDSILEPSCGDGAIVRAIWKHHPDVGLVFACEVQKDLAVKVEKEFGAERLAMCCGDFLSIKKESMFDKIIANPPFTRGQDVRHVNRMWELLRPGGRLVVLTGPSWTFRSEKLYSDFRDFVAETKATVEEIPAGVFRASGTNIRTMLLIINK